MSKSPKHITQRALNDAYIFQGDLELFMEVNGLVTTHHVDMAVRDMSVGSLRTAQQIADTPWTKGLEPSEAFMQGFRHARNNLQDCKKRYLPPNRKKEENNGKRKD